MLNSGIVPNKDKDLISTIIERLIIEKDVVLRLRLSAILNNIASQLIPSDELVEYKIYFEKYLYDVDNITKYNKREVILTSEVNSIAYFSDMKCDEDFVFNYDLESDLISINKKIDDFLSFILTKIVLEGSFKIGN